MDEKTTGVETVNPMTPTVKAPTIATETVTPQVTTPKTSDIYSDANIQSYIQNIDYSNPYNMYTAFMQSPAIIAAQQAVQQTQSDISGVQQGLRNTTAALQAQNESAYGTTGASINLIGKQVGRATNLASNQLAALGETLQGQQTGLGNLTRTAEAYYGIAQQERSKIESLMEATGGEAGITWNDKYTDALAKAKKWEKKEQKKAKKEAEKEAKKASKKEIKSALNKLGVKYSSGMSSRELERLYGQVTTTPVKKASSGGSSTSTKAQLQEEGTSGIEQYFISVRGNDGYVSPQSWSAAKSQWAKNGLSTDQFNAIFGGYKNPNDKYN